MLLRLEYCTTTSSISQNCVLALIPLTYPITSIVSIRIAHTNNTFQNEDKTKSPLTTTAAADRPTQTTFKFSNLANHLTLPPLTHRETCLPPIYKTHHPHFPPLLPHLTSSPPPLPKTLHLTSFPSSSLFTCFSPFFSQL